MKILILTINTFMYKANNHLVAFHQRIHTMEQLEVTIQRCRPCLIHAWSTCRAWKSLQVVNSSQVLDVGMDAAHRQMTCRTLYITSRGGHCGNAESVALIKCI